MKHHIDFQNDHFKKNYIGTLKHSIFEKIMILCNKKKTINSRIRLTNKSVEDLARDHVYNNQNLLRINNKNGNFQTLWNKVKSDFNYFSIQCKNFGLSYINTDKCIQFKTHLNTLAQIQILSVKCTEKKIKSEKLGIYGKVDIIFDCIYYPDIENFPEKSIRKDVIADLKTGQFTKKNNHQIMYYMMAYFEEQLDDQLGIVIYSKSPAGEKGFTFDLVFSFKHYFLQLVMHRNRIEAGNPRPVMRIRRM